MKFWVPSVHSFNCKEKCRGFCGKNERNATKTTSTDVTTRWLQHLKMWKIDTSVGILWYSNSNRWPFGPKTTILIASAAARHSKSASVMWSLWLHGKLKLFRIYLDRKNFNGFIEEVQRNQFHFTIEIYRHEKKNWDYKRGLKVKLFHGAKAIPISTVRSRHWRIGIDYRALCISYSTVVRNTPTMQSLSVMLCKVSLPCWRSATWWALNSR